MNTEELEEEELELLYIQGKVVDLQSHRLYTYLEKKIK
jgi:hypothetical protein